MRRLALLAALVALVIAAPARAADVTAYAGFGTWVDLYAPSAWRAPEATVALMRARGVQTLYLETGNWRQRVDLVRPAQTARLVEAAHDAGMAVVAWYLPSLANPARDLRRALAAIDFSTPRGDGFDSVALDIEATVVRSVAVRNARLLRLSQKLRAHVGPEYPLGAIIPPALGFELHPSYWPRFPYLGLARTYDVFLPMAYFTYRARTRLAAREYVVRSIEAIRSATDDPDVAIHVIGGLGRRTTGARLAGFLDALRRCGPIGFSVYEFYGTKPAAWTALAAAAVAAPEDRSACVW